MLSFPEPSSYRSIRSHRALNACIKKCLVLSASSISRFNCCLSLSNMNLRVRFQAKRYKYLIVLNISIGSDGQNPKSSFPLPFLCSPSSLSLPSFPLSPLPSPPPPPLYPWSPYSLHPSSPHHYVLVPYTFLLFFLLSLSGCTMHIL